jgi:hypothetical protein
VAKTAGQSKSATRSSSNGADLIAAYSRAQPPERRVICDGLRKLIDAAIPAAASKIWHGGPVWFLDDNPVVGYDSRAKGVNLLFWNGQAFDEPDLKPVGKYGAARASFAAADEVRPAVVRRWLKKAKADVFDSKAFFQKRRQEEKERRQKER